MQDITDMTTATETYDRYYKFTREWSNGEEEYIKLRIVVSYDEHHIPIGYDFAAVSETREIYFEFTKYLNSFTQRSIRDNLFTLDDVFDAFVSIASPSPSHNRDDIIHLCIENPNGTTTTLLTMVMMEQIPAHIVESNTLYSKLVGINTYDVLSGSKSLHQYMERKFEEQNVVVILK